VYRLEIYRHMQHKAFLLNTCGTPQYKTLHCLETLNANESSLCTIHADVNNWCYCENMSSTLAHSPFGGGGWRARVFTVGSTGLNVGLLEHSTSVIPVVATMNFGYNDPFTFPDRFIVTTSVTPNYFDIP
jgi:hypothetical protein